MVTFRKMTEEEYDRFFTEEIEGYAETLTKGRGLDRKTALSESEKEFKSMLPDGLHTKDQFVSFIEDAQSGKAVGEIWFGYETEDGIRQAFLAEFQVYETEREKGYGTAALREIERIANENGCVMSALYVWDHNPRAYKLYEKCGYKTVSHSNGGSYMKKKLPLWEESNMTQRTFHDADINAILKIKGKKGYGVSLALAKGDGLETYCSGSGRYGQNFPVNPDMLFQAASISKPMFAMTVLRYADKGIIDIDADISGVISDFVKGPMTFSALLSHTAGINVHWFPGYRADHALLTLEDIAAGRGNRPRIRRIKPYGKQYMYSGGGIELAELAFTRITEMTLRDAFQKEIADPLGLTRTGYFQPLDEDLVANAAFAGRYAYREDPAHGYHYYPEHAAAGMWTTPTELTKLGLALSRSYREGGLLKKETARRMVTPVLNDYGLCIARDDHIPDQVYHTGGNEGFIAYWTLSLTEDLCAAVMFNGSNRVNNAVAEPLFDFVDRLIVRGKS